MCLNIYIYAFNNKLKENMDLKESKKGYSIA